MEPAGEPARSHESEIKQLRALLAEKQVWTANSHIQSFWKPFWCPTSLLSYCACTPRLLLMQATIDALEKSRDAAETARDDGQAQLAQMAAKVDELQVRG